jgi:hypothetical protein
MANNLYTIKSTTILPNGKILGTRTRSEDNLDIALQTAHTMHINALSEYDHVWKPITDWKAESDRGWIVNTCIVTGII